MITRSYSEMVQQWQENWNFAEVFSGDLELLTLSDMEHMDNAYNNMPLDSTLSSDSSRKHFLIRNKGIAQSPGVIIMVCHNDINNSNKYYLWGRTLAERTGKSVLIPDMRCTNNPQDLSHCLINFCNKVRMGDYPLLSKNTVIDIFANGNGIKNALQLLDSDKTDLKTSKILLLDNDNQAPADFDYSSGAFFKITLGKMREKKRFFAQRENPVHGYSSLNLDVSFDFTTNNLFPLNEVKNPKNVDYQFDKVFTMASWFLCGIN